MSQRSKDLLVCRDVPLEGGGSFEWEFLSPTKLLAFRIQADADFQRMVAAAISSTPPSLGSPWSLVVGFDEFAPGNKLKIESKRKCMVLSFSFLELGQRALSQSAAWTVPVIVRASKMHECSGGWGRFLRDTLQELLFGNGGLATSGVAVEVKGEPVLLFARLCSLLSDGDGHRIAYDWRGSSSMKPCIKHTNVLKKDPKFSDVVLCTSSESSRC